MAATLTITGIRPAASVQSVAAGIGSGLADGTKGSIIVEGTIALTGSYTAGGDPLTIVSSAAGQGLPFQFGNLVPHFVSITELGVLGTAVSGFQYVYVWGPTLANPTQNGGGIQIFGAGAGSGQGGTQISGTYAGTTPALTTQVLNFFALFSTGV
jgi:hypothetical protein